MIENISTLHIYSRMLRSVIGSVRSVRSVKKQIGSKLVNVKALKDPDYAGMRSKGLKMGIRQGSKSRYSKLSF